MIIDQVREQLPRMEYLKKQLDSIKEVDDYIKLTANDKIKSIIKTLFYKPCSKKIILIRNMSLDTTSSYKPNYDISIAKNGLGYINKNWGVNASELFDYEIMIKMFTEYCNYNQLLKNIATIKKGYYIDAIKIIREILINNIDILFNMPTFELKIDKNKELYKFNTRHYNDESRLIKLSNLIVINNNNSCFTVSNNKDITFELKPMDLNDYIVIEENYEEFKQFVDETLEKMQAIKEKYDELIEKLQQSLVSYLIANKI